MDLKDIMLSEMSQRKTNTVWSYLYVEAKKSELIETENRLVGARVRSGWGWEEWMKGFKMHKYPVTQ